MNASLDTYRAVLWAIVQGSPPWLVAAFVFAVIVGYEHLRRRGLFARRGGRS